MSTEQWIALNCGSPQELNEATRAALNDGIQRSLNDYAFQKLICEDNTTDPAQRRVRPAVPDTPASHIGQEQSKAGLSDEEAMLALSEPNKEFRMHLESKGLYAIENSGKDNNCAIYALVQQLEPHWRYASLDDEVRAIRAEYDKSVDGIRQSDLNRTDDRKRKLLLDKQRNGCASSLLNIINTRYNLNVAVAVVQAGRDEHPVYKLGTFFADGKPEHDFTHRLVVWDLGGHYEAVGRKPQPPA
ncbi:hypothetical protein [Paraburkholderia rhizosphaerae]|uniref:hypothetical protein n=1 Tax=Paraburkholderia rhizosphaerae TaxID=480658 RepID=UPI0010661F0E|nr:hypothetical protein [Paraburkholderia rhizosphaerae]